jgi:hypothetical protein
MRVQNLVLSYTLSRQDSAVTYVWPHLGRRSSANLVFEHQIRPYVISDSYSRTHVFYEEMHLEVEKRNRRIVGYQVSV